MLQIIYELAKPSKKKPLNRCVLKGGSTMETCGGVGYFSRNFAPTQKPTDPIGNYARKRREYQQQSKIDRLEDKARTEGLSTKEKVDLAATKIDLALSNNNSPNIMYCA